MVTSANNNRPTTYTAIELTKELVNLLNEITKMIKKGQKTTIVVNDDKVLFL